MREIVKENWRKGLEHIGKEAPWIRSWRQQGKGELEPQGKEHVTGSHKDGGDRGSGTARDSSWSRGRKERNS